jgi:2-hydroxychromene-2-carboxylate isomerase
VRDDAGFGEVVARRVLPRAVVAESRLDGFARMAAASRRALGRRGRVELYFAFDDPSSAVALLDLADRLQEHQARLVLLPVVGRGIPGDPAAELKRSYAVGDARRLAGRMGLSLMRADPRAPETTAFLAEWVASGPQGPALIRFCVEAMTRLWLEAGERARPGDLAALWRALLGGSPGRPGGPRRVRRNERRMRLHGIYDVPAAWVHGEWFFAHERAEQIEHRLDELGWGPA